MQLTQVMKNVNVDEITQTCNNFEQIELRHARVLRDARVLRGQKNGGKIKKYGSGNETRQQKNVPVEKYNCCELWSRAYYK